MKIKISFFIILLFFAASAFGALPNTDDLIPAWESYVKSRPDTDEFTKIRKDTYKFKSKKFDYDGTIKIIDTMISDANVNGKVFKEAIIQIELPGLAQEVSKKVSFQTWRQNITMFMFDVENSKWLNYEEYTQFAIQKFNKNIGVAAASQRANRINYYDSLIVALSVLVIFAFVQSRKYTKSMTEQYHQAIQDSREHQQEVMNELRKSNELLAKLLKESDSKSKAT